ncbi:Fic family protein (plasmid) [Cereibacter azotoformans]|uniref:Fido domain-containing protein n=1 Tax=Cereibacter sphaeroides (strain ATCC 17025 / ATH 2.4.3) TaxID=349102 RepID=A4X0B7_CERS5|nr:Fic family protein [Cereibacter azotoformans]AXQ96157.1 Fic family protein [Cereibacter sphaeroides]UIJ32997.1 Fic family protein [Cereibacter azotoformans]
MQELVRWNWQQPDWPHWRFRPEALVEQEREFLLRSGKLVGAWQHLAAAERDQAKIALLSEEAVMTSAIEGEVLDRASVQSSVRRQFGLSSDRRAGPAESGIAEMMVDCFTGWNEPLTTERIWTWHELVCRGRSDLRAVGRYRDHPEAMQVVSGPIHAPKVHFEAPPSDRMAAEMDRFLGWFQISPLPSLVRAGLAHLWFVSIHPFEDGNGRIARAICETSLARSLGQPSLVALSRQIERDRKGYYAALEANNRQMEVTPWLVWFADTVLRAQDYSSALIAHLIAKTRMLDRLRNQLNPRQERALLRMFDAGPDGFLGGLSAKNYMTITGAPPATATRDLRDLVVKEALVRTGEQKATRYWLKLE